MTPHTTSTALIKIAHREEVRYVRNNNTMIRTIYLWKRKEMKGVSITINWYNEFRALVLQGTEIRSIANDKADVIQRKRNGKLIK